MLAWEAPLLGSGPPSFAGLEPLSLLHSSFLGLLTLVALVTLLLSADTCFLYSSLSWIHAVGLMGILDSSPMS